MKKGNDEDKWNVSCMKKKKKQKILNISREKSSILASQRRMERKLKELNATLDQERTQHVEQRDQVTTAPLIFH